MFLNENIYYALFSIFLEINIKIFPTGMWCVCTSEKRNVFSSKYYTINM